MFFQDVDRAPAWIEIPSLATTGIAFCAQQNLGRTIFADLHLQKAARGWSGGVQSTNIILENYLPPGPLASWRKGEALLPEEERVIFLWQSSGEIIISSEDRHWNDQLWSRGASPELLVERPGGNTLLWRLPPGSVRIRA